MVPELRENHRLPETLVGCMPCSLACGWHSQRPNRVQRARAKAALDDICSQAPDWPPLCFYPWICFFPCPQS